jgi:plasmid stability protein
VSLRAVASSDGGTRWLVANGVTDTLDLWSAHPIRRISAVAPPARALHCARFVGASRVLLSTSETTRVVNAADGSEVAHFAGWVAVVASDESRALVDARGGLEVRSLTDGSLIDRLEATRTERHHPVSWALSADGGSVAVIFEEDGSAFLWRSSPARPSSPCRSSSTGGSSSRVTCSWTILPPHVPTCAHAKAHVDIPACIQHRIHTEDAMERINLNVPKDARARLRGYAKRHRKSETAVARDLLLGALEEAEREEFYEKAAETMKRPGVRERLLEIHETWEKLRARAR